jgi:RNA recognition motif-containing protein
MSALMGMSGMSPLGNNMLGNYGFSPAAANFSQMFGQRQMGLSPLTMNTNALSGGGAPYSPAVAAAAAAAAGGQIARTVYIGNLPSDASVDELLNLVHFGPIENVRVLPEKSCVFVSFLDSATAAAFHADATVKKLALHGQELKIGWGKPSPVPSQVMLSISQSNASRNVYLGGLPEDMTEEQLRDDMSRFGLIDQVKIVRDKNIGFVHFLSISTATKVVATLPTEAAWAGRRVNYGKDRCAYIPKSQQAAAAAAQVAAAQSLVAQSAAAQLATPLSAAFTGFPSDLNSPASAMLAQSLNRTVYLGNIHPETTTEDLCNAIRGGMLQSIRYMQDKHIAFVTFIDPAAAFSFYQVSTFQGLTLNNRRLKIGWGKNSGPLQPAVALAVHGGATRNVYVGNIEDFEVYNEEKLKRDFGEYGDIELVNFLKEKNCSFINFTNISNALKAIEGIKGKPDYANLRIAHGKDRCANPPRASSGGQSAGGPLRSSRPSGNSPTDKDKDPASAKGDGVPAAIPEDDTIDEAAIAAAVKQAEAELAAEDK